MKRLLFGCLLTAGLVAPAFAQGAPPVTTRVRGTIASLTGNVLTVNGITGAPTKITLSPDFRVNSVYKISLDKIVAGSYIGTAAEPQADGTLRALEIYAFPPGLKPGPGSRPYDLTPTSTMTNGTIGAIGATKVDKVDANIYTVTYEGGEKKVVVTPSTVVVTSASADASALMVGQHVVVIATKKDDGSLAATGVNVGKDGFVPPM